MRKQSNSLKKLNQSIFEKSLNSLIICKAIVCKEFAPSPYEKNSLSLKIGDEIDVIDMSETGTWTGILNKKIGTFKFIHVNLLESVDNNTILKESRNSLLHSNKENLRAENHLEDFLRSRSVCNLSFLQSTHNLLASNSSPTSFNCINCAGSFSASVISSHFDRRPSLPTCNLKIKTKNTFNFPISSSIIIHSEANTKDTNVSTK